MSLLKNKSLTKLQILIKSIRLLKNWYLYILVYYGLVRKPHIIFETKTGLKIKIRVNSTDLMAFTHVWLIQEYSTRGFEIHKEDTIIDVGAHIGLFSLFASQICTQGKIYCFEPIEENYRLLQENINMNQISNIFSFNKAVSKSESSVKIYLNEDDSGHSMFSSNSEFSEVKSTTLKNILDENDISECNLLKLDCEGAEYEIIDTLPENYFKRIQRLAIEYHLADSKPELLKQLQKKLSQYSYTITMKPLFADIGFLYALSSK